MTEVQIAEFAETCLAVLERVRQTGQPVVVTRAGRPVARIVPPPPARSTGPEDWMGCMSDRTEITGDIVAPAADPSEWDALSR